MLKQHGITSFFTGSRVPMLRCMCMSGFGIYGVDIFVETDDAEKGSTELVKEI